MVRNGSRALNFRIVYLFPGDEAEPHMRYFVFSGQAEHWLDDSYDLPLN
jgi:hypothetical protein